MDLFKIYLVIFMPVIAAVVMVYTNFYIKKRLNDLKKKREEENSLRHTCVTNRKTERVLAEYLKLHNNGDIIEDQDNFIEKSNSKEEGE